VHAADFESLKSACGMTLIGSVVEFRELCGGRLWNVRRPCAAPDAGKLAQRLKSSQSRVAKMEAGDKTVSLDLLVKALFSLGAKPRDVGRALQRRSIAAA
jgi:predicted HicB family RNase H-like nuclease